MHLQRGSIRETKPEKGIHEYDDKMGKCAVGAKRPNSFAFRLLDSDRIFHRDKPWLQAGKGGLVKNY